MRRFLADESGLTLTELLVVSLLMGIVISSIWMAFGAVTAVADNAQARAIAADESRQALDRLSREFRQAQENEEGTGVFSYIEPRRCTFFVDLDQDARPERVTYWVANGALWRCQASPTNNTAPFTFGADGPAEKLVKRIRPDWTGDIFQYYTCDNPPVKITAGQYALISAVRIQIVNQAQTGRRVSNVDAATWVRVRSVQNSLD